VNTERTRSLLATLASVFWLLGLGTCTLGTPPTSNITGAILILTGSAFLIGLAIVNTLLAITRKPDPAPPKKTTG